MAKAKSDKRVFKEYNQYQPELIHQSDDELISKKHLVIKVKPKKK